MVTLDARMIHTRATNYINHHSEEAAKIYANRKGIGQDVELRKYAIRACNCRLIRDPSPQIFSALECASMDLNLNQPYRALIKDDPPSLTSMMGWLEGEYFRVDFSPRPRSKKLRLRTYIKN